MKTLHRTQGLTHDLIVTRKGRTLTLWSAAGVRHTVLDLETPHLPGLEYARNTLAALAFSPRAHSFLILGLGGGSIPRMLFAARPGIEVDTVEIDPAVPELARKFFQVDLLPRLRIYLEDAAAFMKRCTSRYDVIVVDAYVGETFPDQCATREFLAKARECLNGDGVLVVNWMSGNRRLYERLVANLEAEVGSVWQLAGTQSHNALLFVYGKKLTRKELAAEASRIEHELPFRSSLARLVQRLRPLTGALAHAYKSHA